MLGIETGGLVFNAAVAWRGIDLLRCRGDPSLLAGV